MVYNAGRPKYNICPNNGSLSIPKLEVSDDGEYKVILQGLRGLKEKKTRVKVQRKRFFYHSPGGGGQYTKNVYVLLEQSFSDVNQTRGLIC